MRPTEAIMAVEGNKKCLRLFDCRFIDKKWDTDKEKSGYLLVLTTEKEEKDLPEYKDKHNKKKLKEKRDKFKIDKKVKFWFKTFLEAEDKYIKIALKVCGVKVNKWVAGK